MNNDKRVKEIEKITKGDPFGKQEIPWKDKLESMNVFKIPLSLLVYNKYNGRILSRTKSLESQNYKINSYSKEGKELIEKLLWDSKIDRNKITLENINKIGQQKVGIITRDGIVIDGNRRVMLLNKIKKYDYFKAVVLPVTLDENHLEIEKLETSFQMSEDEKVTYNPIEKYIKSKGLYDKGISVSQIANWMGEKESTVKSYLEIMDVMESYLNYLEYKGFYTQLDEREDQFINLTKWIKKYGDKNYSADGFDGYKMIDVDDLKFISFDYIRAKYEGKDFRKIANGRKDNHIFGNKQVWENFRDNHYKEIDKIKDKEPKINLKSKNVESNLNDRDYKYIKAVREILSDNLNYSFQQISYKKDENKPNILINTAARSVASIKGVDITSLNNETLEDIRDLDNKVTEIAGSLSVEHLFSHIVSLLESFDKTKLKHNKNKIKEEIDRISQLVISIKEDLSN